MKFKLGELQAYVVLLTNVLFDGTREENQPKRKLPQKVSYWLSRFGTKIQEEFAAYEERRMELCKAHANLDDKGNPIIITYLGCKFCGAEYLKDATVKDADGKEIPQTVCVCGNTLEHLIKYDIINYEEFNPALADLREVEIELPWRQIPLEAFGEQLRDGEMLALTVFIEEPEGMRIEEKK